MPESFFIVSKDNLELATDEVISIVRSYDRFAKTQVFSNIVIIQSTIPWQTIARRATFVKIAGLLLRKLSNLFLDEDSYLLLQNSSTFSCRVINLSSDSSDTTELERAMGSMISKFSQSKVSLNDPDVVVYLIFTEDQAFFGFSPKFVKDERPKKVKGHPHELDWKLCRAMINLSGIKEDETICDPFCGTGTTLLEASSMKINSIGIDFDKKMCDVSRENVKANGFKSEIYNEDFSYMDKIVDSFDGIVTDIPYGRASKTSEGPEKLLEKLVSKIPKRKKVAIMCKKGTEKNLKWNFAKRYEIYRHKSLTRVILVK